MKAKNRKWVGSAGVVLAIAALMFSGAAVAGGKDLRVGPGQEYATIQAAVDAAKKGNRILVYPDRYFEDVIVAKDDLEILAQGAGAIVLPANLAGFTVTADHVTIRGFEIGYGGAPGQCAIGISFTGSHNTFAENHLYQVSSCLGVNAIAARTVTGNSNHNVIERNLIEDGDIGIAIVADTPDALNYGNVIRDNTIVDIGMTSLAITNGKGFVVSGNRIDTAGFGTCILVNTQSGNRLPQGHHRIADNTVSRCGQHGIWLYADVGADLSHNRVERNIVWFTWESAIEVSASIAAAATRNELVDNDVRFSGAGSGVHVGPRGDGNRIRKNGAYYNNQYGIAVDGDDNEIADNNAYGNGVDDYDDGGSGNRWRKNDTEAP